MLFRTRFFQVPFFLIDFSKRHEQIVAELGKRLMVDSAQIMAALTDETVCHRLGYDTTTIAAMFIPDTYDIYWNTSVDALLERMKKENARF